MHVFLPFLQAPWDAHLVSSGLEELAARMGYGSCIITGHAVCATPTERNPHGTTADGSRAGGTGEPVQPLAACSVSGAGLPQYIHTQIMVRDAQAGCACGLDRAGLHPFFWGEIRRACVIFGMVCVAYRSADLWHSASQGACVLC